MYSINLFLYHLGSLSWTSVTSPHALERMALTYRLNRRSLALPTSVSSGEDRLREQREGSNKFPKMLLTFFF